MSVTAKELARILHLSEAAVSFALNNKPGVSARTRQMVWEKAGELGYDFTRGGMRRAGIRGAVGLICYRKSGAIIGDEPFLSPMVAGAQAGCRRYGYETALRLVREDDRLEEQLYDIRAAGFAGLILLATEMDLAALEPFLRLETPLVLLDASFDEAACDSVTADNAQGAFLATDHLIRRRGRQPGYLRSACPASNFERRAEGFERAVRRNGMSPNRSAVHRLAPSREGAHADMRALLRAGEALADCYFADSDEIAAGAVDALREAGYRIPEDVAVAGFGDQPLGGTLMPPLTTVHVSGAYLGEMAAQRLAQAIENDGHVPSRLEVRTALVKRKST